MEEIRSFSEEHVRDTANLYLKAARGQFRAAPQALVDQFRESFLDNPWAVPDITPLVYLEKGKLVGFLGVIPRPMEFRGRPIRVATITVWLVDHELHRGLAGMKLLGHLFKGPQEFSYTDGAGNDSGAVYTALGAKISRVHSFNWIRVLRPFQLAQSLFDRVGGVLPKFRGAAGLVAKPMDFLLSKAPGGILRAPKSQFSFRSVSAVELLECIRAGRGREALRPAYAMPSFDWLISQAGKGPGHKGLRTVTVHDADGAPCGWFVYYASQDKPAYVLQIGAYRQLQFTGVLSALFQDAWEQGCSAVKGQAIPQFLTNLTEQHCVFRQPYSSAIGHSSNPEIMNAFRAGDVSLSRLDAGSWLRFSSENWD